MDSRNIGSSILSEEFEQVSTTELSLMSSSIPVDPRAPYKVYEGEECKGIYATRAEARREQQRFAEAETSHFSFVIKDRLGKVVL